MSESVMIALQGGIVWLGVELFKRIAPKFWDSNSKLVKLLFVALASSAVAITGGILGGLGALAIAKAAGLAFVAAVFGKNVLTAMAVPPQPPPAKPHT